MPAPKMPASVRIGHRRFTIKLSTVKELGDDTRGDIAWLRATIRIRKDLLPQDAAEVMLHEVYHGCFPHVPKSLPQEDVEEYVVTALAENTAQVWRDNPALVAWLSHNLGA